MNGLKNAIIHPYVLSTMITTVVSTWMFFKSNFDLSWLSSLLSSGAMASIFLYMLIAKPARVNPLLPFQLALVLISCIMLIFNFSMIPAFITLGVGLLGYLGYTFWHTRLGRNIPNITLGKPLPNFSLLDVSGNIITPENLKGKITLLLFIRGNWCPLCVAQIKEIAMQYQSLARMGAQTLFISPQNQHESRILARRFTIPGIFASDDNFEFAKLVDVVHEKGAPKLTNNMQEDTVFPTVLILDKEGKVVWYEATDNYLTNPEPIQFIPIIESLSQA